jgi:hypothetical protein
MNRSSSSAGPYRQQIDASTRISLLPHVDNSYLRLGWANTDRLQPWEYLLVAFPILTAEKGKSKKKKL